MRYALDDEAVCQQGQVRSYCEPSVYDPTGDLLYRNDGNTFADVTEATGITLKGKGLGVALADYDRDGDTDIYVANDGTMNFLYANQHSTFAEVGLIAGTRYNEHGHADAGMGVDFGDYDRDGDADLFVTNFAFETNALYRNDGQGQFAVATQRLGLADPSYRPLGFGTKFFDYDNDGDLDLFAANGHVIDRIAEVDSSQTYRQPNQMFRNDAGRRFADVSATLGPDFQRANAGRATAVADYDDDGDLDLLVTTVAARTEAVAQRRRQCPPLATNLVSGKNPSRRPRHAGRGCSRRNTPSAGAPIGRQLSVQPRPAPALRTGRGHERPSGNPLARWNASDHRKGRC